MTINVQRRNPFKIKTKLFTVGIFKHIASRDFDTNTLPRITHIRIWPNGKNIYLQLCLLE